MPTRRPATDARATAAPTRATLADAGAWLQLDRQLCFAAYSASLAMTRLYKPLLEPHGLTYPQYLVLLVLWEQDGRSVGELGERLFLDSGTLTPLLKRMEAAGWLSRERSAEDERRVIVKLSDEGRALRRTARDLPQRLAGASGCGVEQLGALTRELQRLRDQVLASLPDASTPA